MVYEYKCSIYKYFNEILIHSGNSNQTLSTDLFKYIKSYNLLATLTNIIN